MLQIRFPNGQVVTYSTAGFLEHGQYVWHLFTKNPKDGGSWVASVPANAGVIVERVVADRVENPLTEMTAEKALHYVAAHVSEYQGYSHKKMLLELKQKLAAYDGRQGVWKKE